MERFQKRLHVNTVPRTLLVEIRFRTHNAALSADVVNAMIRLFEQQEAEARVAATGQATQWLQGQLAELKDRADRQDRQLADFEKQHGILIAPEQERSSQSGQHLATLAQVDELSQELVAATSDRILREGSIAPPFRATRSWFLPRTRACRTTAEIFPPPCFASFAPAAAISNRSRRG